MNTHPIPFACRVVRAWAALRDDGEAGLVARHTASCAACQRHFAAATQLTSALRRNAPAQRVTPPAGLDQRILAALERPVREPGPERHLGRYVLAFAGAAAALALAFLGPWRNRTATTPSVPPTIARHDAAPTIASPTATSAVVGDRLAAVLDSLPEWKTSVTNALEKEPLRQEVDFVYSDARSAVRFLAMNFLPAESSASPTRRAQSDG